MTKLIVKRLSQIVGIVILAILIGQFGSVAQRASNLVAGPSNGAAVMAGERSTDAALGIADALSTPIFPILAGLAIAVIAIFFISGVIKKDIPFLKQYFNSQGEKNEEN